VRAVNNARVVVPLAAKKYTQYTYAHALFLCVHSSTLIP
jgi:hypothetical protein